MGLIERRASDPGYLSMVTNLLQRIRLASPEAGLWEAGDLQWAWRRIDQHADPVRAMFWTDDSEHLVAGATITSWTERIDFDLFVHPDAEQLRPTTLLTVLDRLSALPPLAVETSLDDDSILIELLEAAGFVATHDVYVSCWLHAPDRPPVSDLAPGYQLLSRADRPDVAHHMISRNGQHVAERLLECSLYDPALDLFVEAPDGSVAAYGLFWPDLVTGVGLVEPMRTEDAHQGFGLARHVLTSGVERLAAAGCSRMKITYMEDNAVSKHVYTSSGFVATTFAHTYRRPAAVD